MESYHKRKRDLSSKYDKLINISLQPIPDKIEATYKKKKDIDNISDERGLELAYKQKDGLYQHYNKLFIAGTKDFPQDHVDDLKLPFDDTLNRTKRGRDADAYIKSHREIDTVIGHSLGGAVALSLEDKYKYDKDANPYGIKQSKTFGAPTVSGNVKNQVMKGITQQLIKDAGIAGGSSIGAAIDSVTGFADEGIATAIGAKKGGDIATDFATRITEDTNTSPDRIRRFGDPVSMFDRNAQTVYTGVSLNPFKNHSYRGLEIADKVKSWEVEKQQQEPQSEDTQAQVIMN